MHPYLHAHNTIPGIENPSVAARGPGHVMYCEVMLMATASSGKAQFWMCDVAPRQRRKCLDHQNLFSERLPSIQSSRLSLAPVGAGVR
jgi:hypothetical protein